MSTRYDSLFAIEPVITLDDAVALSPNERVREVTRLGEIAKTIRGGKLDDMLDIERHPFIESGKSSGSV